MKKLLIISLLTFSNLVIAQTNFLCVAEKSTGFQFNKSKNDWESVKFIAESKFILKQTSSNLEVVKMGQALPPIQCPKLKPNSILDCSSRGEHFTFNPVGLKFTYYSSGGYAVPAIFPDSTIVEIGVCSPL